MRVLKLPTHLSAMCSLLVGLDDRERKKHRRHALQMTACDWLVDGCWGARARESAWLPCTELGRTLTSTHSSLTHRECADADEKELVLIDAALAGRIQVCFACKMGRESLAMPTVWGPCTHDACLSSLSPLPVDLLRLAKAPAAGFQRHAGQIGQRICVQTAAACTTLCVIKKTSALYSDKAACRAWNKL